MFASHISRHFSRLALRAAWFSAWALCVALPAPAEPQAAIQVSAQVIDIRPCAIAMQAIHERLETVLRDGTIAEGDLSLADGLLRIGFLPPTANHPDERLILIEFVAN